jgi:MFS family permease
MKQINKFYLASFLKNQTYFVPILIIFFQNLGLDFAQIFWVLTAGSLFSFLLEIPTGVFADLYGKRKSILISKFVIFLSFLAFGFSDSFLTLLLANLIYELGKSFRSGTETAYVFDYLASQKNAPSYTKVKSHQKFYARLSESLATAIGGYLAVKFGFNFVFFLAAIPALLNALQTITWVKIKEHDGETGQKVTRAFLREAFTSLKKKPSLLRIMVNVLLYSSVFVALGTFVQPYMTEAGLPLAYFGFVYSGFLLIVAFLTRFSATLEERFGGRTVMNALTLVSILPLLILGLGYTSFIGVSLFFFVLMVQNFRSPIANSIFHEEVDSKNRATMGSLLSLFQNSGNLILLPFMGYLADIYSIYTAILVLAGIVALTSTLLWVKKA